MMDLSWIRTWGAREFARVNHLEKGISAAGAFLGMLAVMVVSRTLLDPHGSAWMTVSMGASAVLLFAVPHGQLSQPWPVFGGHLISALIGVTCAKLFAPPVLAGALAVAFAVSAMYYLRCIHPPGGATALTAVLGGEQVHALGYGFLVTPVLVNVLCLLVMAVAVNWVFVWRRYPLAIADRLQAATPEQSDSQLDRTDLAWALRQINSYIDVSDHDLERIVDLAHRHARERQVTPEEIALGGCFSNGEFGKQWQVRKVVHHSGDFRPGRDRVIYRVVAGEERGASRSCSREEFARWARYRVVRNENSWQRIEYGVRTGLTEPQV
jgi:CBS-domain-containing membrane protein